MGIRYKPPRTRNKYDPDSREPFKLSRSRIEFFTRCPRCFYLDRRCGIDRPPTPPFTINSTVDHLLKKEFDLRRAKKETHPLMTAYGIDAIPYAHKELNAWRENFVGIQHHHKETNFIITGAVDDVWVNPKDELIVVDYKATSKDGAITELNSEWHDAYKRQMEIYQWLLRKNSFTVSDTGYFVYCNARRDTQAFDKKLEFEVTLIPYVGDDSWVDDVLRDIKKMLDKNSLPRAAADCDYCAYRRAAEKQETAS